LKKGIIMKKSAKVDRYQGHDYFQVDELLDNDHILARDAVRAWVKQEVSPIIEDYADKAECPTHLFKGLAEIGAFGPSLPVEYGGGGMDEIAYGVIMQELERGDSGIRSMASVQGSLVMYPIYRFGSEEQRRKYLPKLGSGEFIGCFGLTEPDYGSNPSDMITNIKDDGDAYILNGAKMWITNSPVADLAVVWAKDEAGDIRGMIVERDTPGFSAPEIHGKWSLRASITGELVFEDVRVPKANVFPEVKGLKGPLSCLSKARYGIAWGAIGAALDCYDSALRYSQERVQFGRPIGGFQLTQKKLAEMITEITKAQLLTWRSGNPG
jgi:glutaryl-CoA dehydrogenase